jgi:hypothetical protein
MIYFDIVAFSQGSQKNMLYNVPSLLTGNLHCLNLLLL